MIFLTKKRAVIAVLCLLILAGCTVCGVAASAAAASKTYVGTVVLDAGHGGWDGGVVGRTSGAHEAEINLSLALLLASDLRARRYNVVLTRDRDRALGDDKQSDMKARQDIIQKARPDLVLSLHMNFYSDRTRRGAQVFYGDDSVRGEDSAKLMQSILNTHINKVYCARDNLTAQKGDYFIAKCYPCPSLIIECGFLSNAEDEKLLLTSSYQKIISSFIAKAVDAIFAL